MSNVYKALSDPTRRKILQMLREHDMTAGEIAEHFDITKPTLSRHFAILKEADLIYGDKVRTTITYHLNVSVLEDALVSLLDTFDLLRRDSKNKVEIKSDGGAKQWKTKQHPA
ncbi:autorepressor SdpR family transcription factor [bacterium]|nr:autorepressor SdpR family transcription factor [bacterium]